MQRRMLCAWLCGVICAAGQLAFAADPPPQQFWAGKLADKTNAAGTVQPSTDAKSKAISSSLPAASPPREPEWLRRMDKNDRSTLTGGWALQNWSGGSFSRTTAGDRSGPYAPNNYQGGQFQRWNNVSNRQDIPSWNGSTPGFPRQMWSQGYVSPNNYFGADAQAWGNMSTGTMSPNFVSGGWTIAR